MKLKSVDCLLEQENGKKVYKKQDKKIDLSLKIKKQYINAIRFELKIKNKSEDTIEINPEDFFMLKMIMKKLKRRKKQIEKSVKVIILPKERLN